MITIDATLIGKTATRLGSDYTAGRQGRIFEVDAEKKKVRVHWTTHIMWPHLKLNIRTWSSLGSITIAQ